MHDLANLVARARVRDQVAEDELFALAYGGSVEAQRAIIDMATAPREASEPFAPDHWFRVEMMARVAAAKGEIEDVLRLCAVLYLLSLEARQAMNLGFMGTLQAEVLSLLREQVDAGEGEALKALAFYAPLFSEEVRAAAGLDGGPSPVKDWGNRADLRELPPPIVRIGLLDSKPPVGGWLGRLWGGLVDRYWAFRLWWLLRGEG
jgi:hypothetical protein